MLARGIMERASTLLQDEGATRWPLSELADWINDGLREIARQAPSAFAQTVTITLAEGAQQAVPIGYTRMLRPVANAEFEGATRPSRMSVTVVDQALMDAVVTDWQVEARQAQQVRHVMFDEVNPRTFYVYPANDGTGRLRAVLAAEPALVVPSSAPDALASYQTPLGVEAAYANALLDYVLYRCFSKDAQFSGAVQRAALHFQQFAAALNMQVGSDTNMNPNRRAGVAGAAPGVAAGA